MTYDAEAEARKLRPNEGSPCNDVFGACRKCLRDELRRAHAAGVEEAAAVIDHAEETAAAGGAANAVSEWLGLAADRVRALTTPEPTPGEPLTCRHCGGIGHDDTGFERGPLCQRRTPEPPWKLREMPFGHPDDEPGKISYGGEEEP